MTRYRYEKVGNCPNCGFPIMMRNQHIEYEDIKKDRPIPTAEDVIALCPCIEKIHTLAEDGKFGPFWYLGKPTK